MFRWKKKLLIVAVIHDLQLYSSLEAIRLALQRMLEQRVLERFVVVHYWQQQMESRELLGVPLEYAARLDSAMR